MKSLIKAAEAIILAEAKTELKPWEQAVVSSWEKVAEALSPANQKPIEASEEEVNELLKFI